MNDITMNDLIRIVALRIDYRRSDYGYAVMIAITFKRSHMVTGTITVAGLNVGLFTLIGQMIGVIESGSIAPKR